MRSLERSLYEKEKNVLQLANLNVDDVPLPLAHFGLRP